VEQAAEMRDTKVMAFTSFRPRPPTGRPYGSGLHYATASGIGGRKVATTRSWDIAGSAKKPFLGRGMGLGSIMFRDDHQILQKIDDSDKTYQQFITHQKQVWRNGILRMLQFFYILN
jgi:hypothetical protein